MTVKILDDDKACFRDNMLDKWK